MKPFTVTAPVIEHSTDHDADGFPVTLVRTGIASANVSGLPLRVMVPRVELRMPNEVAAEFFPLRSRVSITIACEKENSND